MAENAVCAADLERVLREIGVRAGDACLFHSSFKSLGCVEGGAQAVIDAFEAVLGREGTLVVPTLCQKDFNNSYRTWYMDKPSDVGYLTEYFRKQPYVYRSNQATHSVAARGRLAYELTYEHTARGPHLCPFGEYAFADSSPWRKMYELNAKVVFIGVDMNSHTMKHMIEAEYVEGLLAAVRDPGKAASLKNRLRRFGSDSPVWPFYNAAAMREALEAMGLVRRGRCGDATLLCVEAKPSSDAALQLLRADPGRWLKGKEILDWIRECEAAR